MWDPTSVVPASIMPAYKHLFTNVTDLETAYAEAVTVKKVFNVPYDADIDGDGKVDVPLGSFDEAKKRAFDYAMRVAKETKREDLVNMVKEGKIPEIVALIAYMNRLK
jgi:cytochrome c oxidase cbb3-type subunit 2